MGYTHYWKHGGHGLNRGKLQAAIKDMIKVVQSVKNIPLAGPEGKGSPNLYDDGVSFNGVGDNSHETFEVSDSWRGQFEFCKTARKPYDKVVVACLCILGHHLKDAVKISSDGEVEDWYDGLILARTIIPDCKIPMGIYPKDWTEPVTKPVEAPEEPEVEVIYTHRKIEF